jgi:hypothetical protein
MDPRLGSTGMKFDWPYDLAGFLLVMAVLAFAFLAGFLLGRFTPWL